MTSGYRCPHGNKSVNGINNSLHGHGRAADLLRPGWSEKEFEDLKSYIESLGNDKIKVTNYSRYPKDRHLHFEIKY